MKSVGILGVGRCLPDTIRTNADIVASGIETSHEWIVERTGIHERRIASSETATSDLAESAARDALSDAGKSIDDIDMIIVATTTPDYPLFPSVAAILQDRLGCSRPIAAFDVSAACSGFNYALTTAIQYVKTGAAKNVLVLASDVLSKYIDWTDRSICILFGDGAGGVVVGAVEGDSDDIYSRLFVDGSNASILQVRAGGSRLPITHELLDEKAHVIFMNGRAVFKVAVNSVVPAVETAMQDSGLTHKDIDLVVFHQANRRIFDAAKEKIGFVDSQMVETIHKYGNTSAASIPIALKEAQIDGRLQPGATVLTVGFGAGFSWGVTIFKWRG